MTDAESWAAHLHERGTGGISVALKVLPIPEIARATDLFRCDHLACVLQAQRCVDRQGSVYHSANPKVPDRADGRFPHCTSGKCEQGKAVALAIEGQERQKPRPVNAPAQLAARRRQMSPYQAAMQPRQEVPAEERKVPQLTEKKCSVSDCTQKLAVNNASGKCQWCSRGLSVTAPSHGKPQARRGKAAGSTPPSTEDLEAAFLDRPIPFSSRPGMPQFHEVPVGWIVGLLQYLRDQKIALDAG